MNNIKKIDDKTQEAISRQELHDKLELAYNRIQITLKPKNRIPLMVEFVHEIRTNALLSEDMNELADISKTELVPYLDQRQQLANRIDKIVAALTTYKKDCPVIALYLEEIDALKKNYTQLNGDLVYNLVSVLLRIFFLLKNDRSTDHTKILRQFSEDLSENPTELIFSTFNNFLFSCDRKQKTSISHSMLYLTQLHEQYDPKRRAFKYYELINNNQRTAAYYFETDAQNLDLAMETYDEKNASRFGFDTEEYALHIDRIWKFIKPRLLAPKVIAQNDTYDDATGLLIHQGDTHKFQKNCLPSKILGMLYPAGKPAAFPVKFEDIYHDVIKTQADPEWYELNTAEKKAVNDKIYEACRTTNNRVTTKNDLPFIIVNNTTLVLNNK